MSASVVYRLDDFPELKQKIDRAVSNIELYGSDRYDHMKQVILKHETKFLKRVNALADRDPISGRLSVRNDPNVIRLKERYSQKIHILQESLNRFRTLDTHLKNSGATLVQNYTSPLPPTDPLLLIASTTSEIFLYTGYLLHSQKSGFGILHYSSGTPFAIGLWESDKLSSTTNYIFHRNSQV